MSDMLINSDHPKREETADQLNPQEKPVLSGPLASPGTEEGEGARPATEVSSLADEDTIKMQSMAEARAVEQRASDEARAAIERAAAAWSSLLRAGPAPVAFPGALPDSTDKPGPESAAPESRAVERREERRQAALSEAETLPLASAPAAVTPAASPLAEAETLPLATPDIATLQEGRQATQLGAQEPVPQDQPPQEGRVVHEAMGRRRRSARGLRPPQWPGRLWKQAHYGTGKQRLKALVLLVILLLGIALPIVSGLAVGLQAYLTYSTLRGEASAGVEHLLALKTIFNGAKSHPSSLFEASKLNQAAQELQQAQQSFTRARDTIDHSALIHTVISLFPHYQLQVSSARAAAQIGVDVSVIGLKLIPAVRSLAPHFQGPLLSDSSKPLVTQDMLTLLGRTIDDIMPSLRDIGTQSQGLSLEALPLSSSQRQQVQQLLQMLPILQQSLGQARQLLDAAGWLLGVDKPRTYLVQTMDRSELRPSGGFTGQYGELTINAGRIAPFSLKDISFVEYTSGSPTLGQLAPEPYRSWWPFANWGLRDSNLSADFPTTGQLAIETYQREVGRHVDGVIALTPFFIEHVLQIIGPITVPGYNETITALNLEDRLHFYQLDSEGVRKQQIVQHVDDSGQARKLFTSRLAQTLLDHVRHAPPDEILAIAHEALYDLTTRDIEIYVTDPHVEQLLIQYGYGAQMDRSTSHDGLSIVQANLNATKASQYVRTLIHDVVTLDANGGATHYLQLRLAYTDTGPVYGYDTYRDYVRIYVPPNSKFLNGDGFDSGIPLCGGPLPACNATVVYPHDELMCPAGQYQPGAASPTLSDENPGDWHPLDKVGPPTNTVSDVPGRAMFGGWVVVPKNCTMTVTLSWYVPPLNKGHYSLLVQRQAGTYPELDVTILPPDPCSQLKLAGTHVDTLLTSDLLVTPRSLSAGGSQGHGQAADTQSSCYPRLGV
ncbi:DUF4012 domain-containing protein [Thermogemmatispora onikobensis]|uniref:DUF4012 domain-containing protein n=1 Tax=Thermogemmatispora onikobensis TaxID=732234 RepID=UPI0008535029|nr:DUF4012 domain-containing protein [Thermogemmatispora onikobensis]